eukprot:10756-Heterococcus_DN1.PRE.2
MSASSPSKFVPRENRPLMLFLIKPKRQQQSTYTEQRQQRQQVVERNKSPSQRQKLQYLSW